LAVSASLLGSLVIPWPVLKSRKRESRDAKLRPLEALAALETCILEWNSDRFHREVFALSELAHPKIC